ncbi:cupin domain-containing protein [Streptomyces sp. NBC_00448]|uniref:cupin domain-containing protein n=1 Tax=Streptomyces sp. NBC_00448 TaxID=2903652 RepID=UPI002E214B75
MTQTTRCSTPQPIRDGQGGADPGPRNTLMDLQNPDVLVPPATDAGTMPSLKYPFGQAHMRLDAGGWAREVTQRELPIATTLAGVNMRLEPGGIRELHWHPNNDEWQYYISGQGRMGVFANSGHNRTYDFQPGDVGYVPFAMGHYIENTGDTPLKMLELFRAPRFEDVSLAQWMAPTPRELVQHHLKVGDNVMNSLRREKQPIFRP